MNEFTFHIGKEFYIVNINKKKRKVSIDIIIDGEVYEIQEVVLPKIVINKDKNISDDEFFFVY